MTQLQTVLQLSAVTFPEIIKRCLGFIQLTQESEREEDTEEKTMWERSKESNEMGEESFLHLGTNSLLIYASVHVLPLYSS